MSQKPTRQRCGLGQQASQQGPRQAAPLLVSAFFTRSASLLASGMPYLLMLMGDSKHPYAVVLTKGLGMACADSPCSNPCNETMFIRLRLGLAQTVSRQVLTLPSTCRHVCAAARGCPWHCRPDAGSCSLTGIHLRCRLSLPYWALLPQERKR